MRSPSFPVLNHSPIAATDVSTRVILVRHGRSTFNEQGRYQGSSDESVLTEQGQQTAYQVGQVLRDVKIDAVFASPLKRVKQTVDGIANGIGNRLVPPIYWTRQLCEIDLPCWEGLSFQYVREQLQEEYRCWKERPHEFQMAIAADSTTLQFPVLNLYRRVAQFWQETLPHYQGQTLLIVSHGGTNHALMSTALKLAPEHFHTLQQSNCGVSVLEFPDGDLESAEIRSLNLTHPLGETLPKLKEGKQGLRLLLVPAVKGIYREALIEKMRSLSIDFCLNTDADNAQETAQDILQHHPRTVQLHASCDNFPQRWQQSLRNQHSHSPNVITGLVVSDIRSIQAIIGEAIGLSPDQRWRLQIQPDAMSVVHYPAANHHPVLQALNFGGLILPQMLESKSTPYLNSTSQSDLKNYVIAV